MWIILKYHIRQLFNYWKYLPFRIKVEIIFLLSIFYIYATEKLVYYFRSSLGQPGITPLYLESFVQQVLLLPMLIVTPFVYFNLLPRQKNIQLLRLLPFNSGQSAAVLIVYFWKYELLFFILILPVSTALGITSGLGPALLLIIMTFILPAVTLLCLHLLATFFLSRYKVLFIYLTLVALYYLIFIILSNTGYYIPYPPVVLIFLFLLIYRFWHKYWEKWDLILDHYRCAEKKQIFPSVAINYANLARYIPLTLRPLFIREILLQIRNRKYLHLKLLTFIFFLGGLALVQNYAAENFRPLAALLVIILIWWHYSSQFNDKYVQPESKFFLKTLPLSYKQFVLSKFLSELIYILVLTSLLFAAFLLHGDGWQATSISTLSMFLVSVFILFTTIIIKTLFYDKPRLAGYAYHFMVLFCLIMIVNFYLVGPLISLCVLLYFTYKSYQAFIY
jgi:hypothetical protein